MGKRSNFERREADFYPTPRAAVLPLIPYLRGIRSFAEPCAGDGALVRHLEGFGLAASRLYGDGEQYAGIERTADTVGGAIPFSARYALAPTLGGAIKPPEAEWEARGFRAVDGHDPEGNVVQFRERTD